MLFYIFYLNTSCFGSFDPFFVFLFLPSQLFFDLSKFLLANFSWLLRLWFLQLQLFSSEFSYFLLESYQISLLLFKLLLSLSFLLIYFFQLIFKILYLSLIISHSLFQLCIFNIFLHYFIIYTIPFYCNFFTFLILFNCYCTWFIS